MLDPIRKSKIFRKEYFLVSYLQKLIEKHLINDDLNPFLKQVWFLGFIIIYN